MNFGGFGGGFGQPQAGGGFGQAGGGGFGQAGGGGFGQAGGGGFGQAGAGFGQAGAGFGQAGGGFGQAGGGGFGQAGGMVASGFPSTSGGWTNDGGVERFLLGTGHRFSASSMAWSETEHHLAVTSWEGDVHVLSVNAQNNSVASVQAAHNPPMKVPQPILCSAWTRSMEVLLGTCDGKLLAWDVQKGANAGAVVERGRHEGGIKFCKALHNEDGWSVNGILTGSWDRTVALWDPRQASVQPTSRIKVPGKVYDMDVMCPYFLVAGSDRQISLHDVRNGAQCVSSFPSYSPLMFQTRSACLLSNLNNGVEPQGFAVGGISGELGVVVLRQGENPQQRKVLLTQPAMAGQPQSSARAVNSVTRVPNHPNLVLAGGADGRFSVWNVAPTVAGGQKGVFGDGTPEYKSEDPRNSLPPATNPAIQAKVKGITETCSSCSR